MTSRRRQTLAVAALVAVVAIALVAWSPWSATTRDQSIDAGAPHSMDAPAPPSTLASDPTAPPALAAMASEPTTGISSPTEDRASLVKSFRVRGRVLGLDPVPKDAVVYLAMTSPAPGFYLARQPLAADGRFDLSGSDIPWTGSLFFGVGVFGSDFARVETRVPWNPFGEAKDVELTVERGDAAIEGRVVDENERPLAGVRFVWMEGGSASSGVGDPPDVEKDDERSRDDALVKARSVSAADGAFVVRLPGGRSYDAIPLDPVVVFDGARDVACPSNDVVLRAKKGWRIEVRVRGEEGDDRSTWKGISTWLVAPGGTGGGWMSNGGPDPFVVRGPMPPEGVYERELRVQEQDHKPFTTRIRFDERDRNPLVEVVLRRYTEAEKGRVVIDFDLRDDDGKPVVPEVTVWTTFGTNSSGRDAPVVAAGSGRWTTTLPPGAVTLDTQPTSPFGELLNWKSGPLEIPSGGETTIRPTLAPYGRARLRLAGIAPDAFQSVSVTLTRQEDEASTAAAAAAPGVHGPAMSASATLSFAAGDARIPALPAARWRALARVGNSRLVAEFSIRAGEETIVELTAPR